MADLALARAYVTAYGEPVDVARIDCLSDAPGCGAGAEAVAAAMRRAVGPQGGFAAEWSVDAESVDATCQRLDQLKDLGPAGAPFLDRATSFLSSRQYADGSIREIETLAGLAPPWADASAPAARIYCTANAGRWLATSASHHHSSHRAAGFLRGQLSSADLFAVFPDCRWLAASLFAALGDADSERSLIEQMNDTVDELGPTALGRLASTLADSTLAEDARARLWATQEPDGRWSDVDSTGPRQDVATTVTAVRALLHRAETVPGAVTPGTGLGPGLEVSGAE